MTWTHLPHFVTQGEHADNVLIRDTGTLCPTRLLDAFAHNINSLKMNGNQHSHQGFSRVETHAFVSPHSWACTIANVIDSSITDNGTITGRQLPAPILQWFRDVFQVEQQFNVPPLYCSTGIFERPSVCCSDFHQQECDAMGMLFHDAALKGDFTQSKSLTVAAASLFQVEAWARQLQHKVG
jgi:hypothetical protein